jgi:hypothetical protein
LDLGDIPDVQQARDNLGLGDAAVADIGTAAGTVAAGDDPRIIANPVAFSISGAPPGSVSVTYMVTAPITVPANPVWVGRFARPPTEQWLAYVSYVKAGTTTPVGAVVLLPTGGVVSPPWDSVDLDFGDAVYITAQASQDPTAADLGLAFLAQRR